MALYMALYSYGLLRLRRLGSTFHVRSMDANASKATLSLLFVLDLLTELLADVVLSERERSIHICTYQTSRLTRCPEGRAQAVFFSSELIERVERAGHGVGVDRVVG